jgi:hypothetical protein
MVAKIVWSGLGSSGRTVKRSDTDTDGRLVNVARVSVHIYLHDNKHSDED